MFLQGLQPCTRYKPEQQQQQQRHSVGWRGTVGLRGRREPILGGLVAASMPLTPRKPTVPRLRQFPAAVGNGGCRHAGLLVGVDLGRHGASAASDPLLLFFLSSVAGRTRKLSEVGRGGLAGVSAAWMPRPSPQGWVHGVPRQPTPPRQARLLLQAANHEGLSRSPPQTPAASGCPLRHQCTAPRLQCGCRRTDGRSPPAPS
jgi:hypothetical protein